MSIFALPVTLAQLGNNIGLQIMPDEAVGKASKDCISAVQASTGQTQEQAGAPGGAVQEPARRNIGVEADGDLGHGKLRSFRHHPVRRALHNAHTATHYDAVSPANERFREGMDQVIQLIFLGEECLTLTGTLWLGHAAIQGNDVATGTERLVALGFQPDGLDYGVLRPTLQLRSQQPDHFQRQRVQRFGRIQPGHGDQRAIARLPFFEDNGLITHNRSLSQPSKPASAVFPFRLALFEKRVYAFFLVFGREQLNKQFPLHAPAVVVAAAIAGAHHQGLATSR